MTKNSKKTAALIGGVATVCLIALLSAVWYFSTRFAPSSTGEHIIANQLEEKISFVPYFKDGNIYMLQNGKTILAAENVYDPAAEDPIYTADYAIDAASGKMLYVAEGVLYLFTGEETLVLGSGVSSWRTVAGMDAVAFTTAMSGSSTLGILYLYYDGITVPLDTGVVSNTIRFSQNGQYLFAEKPNTYPQIRSRLICYETQTGTSVVADEDCAPVMWVSNSGSTVITGESFDDTLYSYRIFAQNFKKNKTFENVYYPSVTDDQSVVYLLCNYDLTAKSGDLVAVDLETLRSKKLAENVSFFNSDAVTDPAKGIVYSVCDSQEEGLYSIYYCDIQGRSTRLVRNTDEDTLYNVAINSEKHTGFLLAPGATLQDNAVYVLQWKNGSIETQRAASGYVEDLTYYELTDTVTYLKNPQNSKAELYVMGLNGENRLLCSDAGTVYSSQNRSYSAQTVLSNDAESVLYFADIQIGESSAETSGVLKLSVSGNSLVIAEGVSSSYMSAPIANADMSEIYYCVKREGKLFDLYRYSGGESTLLVENVHGLIALENGKGSLS